MFQSEYLFDHLPEIEHNLSFFYADGEIMPSMYDHEIILAVPEIEAKDALLKAIAQQPSGHTVLTTSGAYITGMPSVSSVTVIDASILQLFDDSPFLKELSPAERIPFVQAIAPDSFSEHGVFVDTYAKYVHFLGLIGSCYPKFFVYAQSPRKTVNESQEVGYEEEPERITSETWFL